MVRSFIRSWGALYDMLGFHEADDPESARSIIVTSIAQRNVNLLLDSSNFYVNIRLHTYFSSCVIRHELEVVQRLGGVLPPSFVEGLSIDVIQPTARPALRPPTPSTPRLTYELADNFWEPPVAQTVASPWTSDGWNSSSAAWDGSRRDLFTYYEMGPDNILFRIKAVCCTCPQQIWSKFGHGSSPYDELSILGWYIKHWRTWCPDCCVRYRMLQEPARDPDSVNQAW